MSGALAIAATTATLRDVLQVGMTELDVGDALGGDVTVTVDSPDVALSESSGEDATSRLNVYLYNVTRNTGYTGDGLAARDGRGDRNSNPILGLDLYYLLTAYAVDDYHAEMLLGGAMQVLHDTAALGRQAIRDALDPATHPGLPTQLQNAGLAEQFEYLKISPLPMPSDEISRLWSSIQSPYRPSAAYMVSAVLLQANRATRSSLPVARRLIRVVPSSELRVDRVISAAGPGAVIDVSSTLRIIGRNLASPDIAVWLNDIDVTAGVVERLADEIRLDLRLPLPPAPPPRAPFAGLHPGVAGVQLVRSLPLGIPATPHEGFSSNVASFVLAPQITPVAAAASVDVTCTPPIGAGQRVRMLLNQSDALPGVTPRSYSFAAPVGNGVVAPQMETDTVNIPIANVVPGNYLVRLQVDGAQSLPGLVAGRYALPVVAL